MFIYIGPLIKMQCSVVNQSENILTDHLEIIIRRLQMLLSLRDDEEKEFFSVSESQMI